MMATTTMTLKELLKYPAFVNKEMYFNVTGKKLFLPLSGERDVLCRLSHHHFKPDALNLAPLFHVNMLQYSEASDFIQVDSELQQLRQQERSKYEDIEIDGKVIIKGTSLDELNPALNDIWLISRSQGIRRCRLLQKTIGEVEMIVSAGLLEVLNESDEQLSPVFLLITGNIARAVYLFGLFGYFRMLIEAGRMIERLSIEQQFSLLDHVDLHVLNTKLKFNPERYSVLAAMSGPRE